jgi:3,4-dihydroxy 2-butanone 4-phosphate synthase/GTP cyclohydrolase II
MISNNLSETLQRFKAGGFVIVTDDENRENEGDLFLLASAATTEKLAFMIRYTSGVICVAMTEERSRQLHLPLMVKNNQDNKRTAFTVTVDAKNGMTTGISAQERALTIKTLGDLSASAEDFVRPGHIFPLVANEGGLLERQGHTEAVVEMCRMVGETEVGVISELVNEDGSMMRGAELITFSAQHKIPILTIADLIKEIQQSSGAVQAHNSYPTDNQESLNTKKDLNKSKWRWANLPRANSSQRPALGWRISSYFGQGGVDHAVVKYGELSKDGPILLRIHSECLTGDVLGSLRCDCGFQLKAAMEIIERAGSGLIIYLRGQEGRGIGFSEKIRAYQLQDQGLDTIEANLALGHEVDEREFLDAVEILNSLEVNQVELLTNNPVKLQTLKNAGITASATALLGEVNEFNEKYIKTKQEKLGHR